MNLCQWCGAAHQGFCPRVKAIEYYDGGIFIKRVEFFSPDDYPPRPLTATATILTRDEHAAQNGPFD